MRILEWIAAHGAIIIAVPVAVAVLGGLIYRIVRAKQHKPSDVKRYTGAALNVFDPITGLPRSMVDKSAVIEYIDERIIENKNDSEVVAGEPPGARYYIGERSSK